MGNAESAVEVDPQQLLEQAQQLFTQIDADQSGTIELDEFHVACQQLGLGWNKQERIDIFHTIDADQNGSMTMQEFQEGIEYYYFGGKKPENPVELAMKRVPETNQLKNIWSQFKKERLLGKGASGTAWLVSRKSDGKKVCLKSMSRKDQYAHRLFLQEVEIIERLRHPNILALEGVYTDKKNYYIALDALEGGELFDIMCEKQRGLSEGETAWIVRSMLLAVGHCHAQNICHRDLKPENMVYASPRRENLVVIDFGDAKHIEDLEKRYDDYVGTPHYLPPEIMRAREGWELLTSDVWTLGAIAFVLLTGEPPFLGRDNVELMQNIMTKKLKWPRGNKFSKECKDFVRRLLTKNTKKRNTAAKALEHPWMEVGVKREAIVRTIRALMEEKSPEKLDNLPKILDKSLGKEYGLYTRMATKYKVDPQSEEEILASFKRGIKDDARKSLASLSTFNTDAVRARAPSTTADQEAMLPPEPGTPSAEEASEVGVEIELVEPHPNAGLEAPASEHAMLDSAPLTLNEPNTPTAKLPPDRQE